jgi:ATP-dependent Clp protease ATP-binding subunit ClpC
VDDRYENMKSTIDESLKRMFNPEFLNRVDDTIIFRHLQKADIYKIIDIQARKLFGRVNDLGIMLEITKSAKDFLAEKGYDEKYGARPLRRALQKYVEDEIAEEMLSGSLKDGDRIRIEHNKGKDKLDFVSLPKDSSQPDEQDQKMELNPN